METKKYSTPIGLLLITLWGVILVLMMLHKIKSFEKQYISDNQTNNQYNSIYK